MKVAIVLPGATVAVGRAGAKTALADAMFELGERRQLVLLQASLEFETVSVWKTTVRQQVLHCGMYG